MKCPFCQASCDGGMADVEAETRTYVTDSVPAEGFSSR